MKHIAVNSFWDMFEKLPIEIQINAKKKFELLKSNPSHPSLHLKEVNEYWSIRIGIKYRALGIQKDENIIWFWIGKHNDYDKLI
ncbi:MAG: hypothetical protein RO257_06510 [Candidatus Kapabacteria bacterium]|jgi:hypothetical protein|nr:hypothetical protein [Candidatus Kapabacteria bacterium]